MSSLSTSLKNSYQRWLFPYEEYLRVAKPGVQQQLEFEYGGPLTPSPANSPIKGLKSHNATPSSMNGGSPAMRASVALNASIKDAEEIFPTKSETPLAEPRPMSSGFTPVNTGGFTPVNASPAPSGFTPVNYANGVNRDSVEGTPPRRISSMDSPLASSKNTPEYKPSGLSNTPLTNGSGAINQLKRQFSQEQSPDRRSRADAEASPQTENGDSENGGRRSKRLKKGMCYMIFRRLGNAFVPSLPGSAHLPFEMHAERWCTAACGWGFTP
jgi:[histone H3]-trimethyl-L-lysine4 demethylase